MEAIMEIIRELDWSPLFISLKTGVVATVISFFLGIFTARKVMNASPAKKSGSGWNTDASDGTSADGCRIFSAAFV